MNDHFEEFNAERVSRFPKPIIDLFISISQLYKSRAIIKKYLLHKRHLYCFLE